MLEREGREALPFSLCSKRAGGSFSVFEEREYAATSPQSLQSRSATIVPGDKRTNILRECEGGS
jgi:hypothetical protein